MSWCPTPDCKFAFMKHEADDDTDFHCPLCKNRSIFFLFFLNIKKIKKVLSQLQSEVSYGTILQRISS